MSLSSKAPNPEKGKRYFQHLDQALCNANWGEIPELARKTDKHAPQRRCFTLTARTEAQLAVAISTAPTRIPPLDAAVPLSEAIAREKHAPEDAYCASVCLAEMYLMQNNLASALKALPEGAYEARTSDNRIAPLGWLEVTAVKATCIRAAAFEAGGRVPELENLYHTAITQTPGSRTPELRRYTERLLARACTHYSAKADPKSLSTSDESLRAFRAWGSFWQRSPPPSARDHRVQVPRRQIWKGYYTLLSSLLQRNLLSTSSAGDLSDSLLVPYNEASEDSSLEAKQRQRVELKRIEATYESLLLNETQFPKASQDNEEVEQWVEQAIKNWEIMCGPTWTDAELGKGGKEAVSRGVLDILYRAATKTFHSTSILRHLFTVHGALGDFNLSIHAFDSYVEIVGKGKARAAKTGKHELGFDNNDIALLAAADAVRELCRYGDRDQAEKAVEVAKTIEKWLGQQLPPSDQEAQGNSDDNRAEQAHPPYEPTESRLQATTLAAAYRAIGVSQAHWARMTYESDTRSGLQAKAISNFRMSANLDDSNIETIYVLAKLLAETRDVTAATEVLKRCLENPTPSSAVNGADEDGHLHADLQRRRQLMPLWHLLALCLTARDEYESAMGTTEAALGLLGDLDVLFGRSTFQSSDSEKRMAPNPAPHSLVEQMDAFEREVFIQLKMSQLTLLELTEGPLTAAESSADLIHLYTGLFGDPDSMKIALKPPPTAVSVAPSRASGTLRSLVGSIRPRSVRSARDHSREDPFRPSTSTAPPRTSAGSGTRPEAANGRVVGAPVSITVTNEDGEKTQHDHHRHHLHLPFKVRGHHGDFREVGSLRSKHSAENVDEKQASDGEEKPLPVPPKDTDAIDYATIPATNPPVVGSAVQHIASTDSASRPDQPLKEIEHNAPHNQWPSPEGHDDQPPSQDLRLPAPYPATSNGSLGMRRGSLQDRQHRLSILIEVWLFVAQLYIRAQLHDDAADCIDEACRFVVMFEAERGSEHSSARNFYFKGWGGGKSVDELWADVWSAVSLSLVNIPFRLLGD